MTKKTVVCQTLSTFEKAHKNASDGVPNRTINTRAAKKDHLKNLRATNERHVPYTAAKDQQSDCDVLC